MRSKIFSPFENPYIKSNQIKSKVFIAPKQKIKININMTSYLTSIDTFSLSQPVFEIFDFNYSDGNPTSIRRQRVYRDSPEQYFNIILAVK